MSPDQGKRIIRSWAGAGTAETIYETEDGRTWRYQPMYDPPRQNGTTAGSGLGRIVGDRIYNVP